MVPDLLDGGRSGESCLEARLLILGVAEGHVGQSHEGKDVAQRGSLIVDPFGGRPRTEGSAPRGDDVDLLALQDALRGGGGEENRLADADDLIDLRLQGRGNCEGVHGSADLDGVGLDQFCDRRVGDFEHLLLVGGESCGI